MTTPDSAMPTTKSGRRLLRALNREGWIGPMAEQSMDAAILAIEEESEMRARADEAEHCNAHTDEAVQREARAAALREVAERLGKLDAVLESLTVSTDGPEPWPWEPAGLLVRHSGDCTWWLDNERQTSAFPDGDDVAAMLNAILDIRAILTEATGASE